MHGVRLHLPGWFGVAHVLPPLAVQWYVGVVMLLGSTCANTCVSVPHQPLLPCCSQRTGVEGSQELLPCSCMWPCCGCLITQCMPVSFCSFTSGRQWAHLFASMYLAERGNRPCLNYVPCKRNPVTCSTKVARRGNDAPNMEAEPHAKNTVPHPATAELRTRPNRWN